MESERQILPMNDKSQNEDREHKRRVRYKGTHPKQFQEKYKELNPDQYPETIRKVIQKGSTPVGMHLSIMVEEILEFLRIKPGQKGLDATLGYGGHTARMLQCLESKGHIYALDVDPIEMEKTRARLKEAGYGEEILTIRQLNFEFIDEICKEAGAFDFVLADLGVSSMQIDNPERGFTYKKEGPLDLRLNPEKGIPASEKLKQMSREELCGMLLENADEPYAEEIAEKLYTEIRRGRPVDTTTRLKEVVEQALLALPKATISGVDHKELVKKTCQRTFQAIRIDINREYEVLYQFLEKLPHVLAPGGRAAILTFHSGEDRLVKKSFRQYKKEGIYEEISEEVVRPSAEECSLNGRARSTKMRWAVKSTLR